MYKIEYFNINCCICSNKFLHNVIIDTRKSKWEPTGKERCNACSNAYTVCRHCNEFLDVNVKWKRILNNFPHYKESKFGSICNKCFDADYNECPECKTSYLKEESAHTMLSGIVMCQACAKKKKFYQCSCCKKWFKKKQLHNEFEDDNLDDEKGNHFIYCASCMTMRCERDQHSIGTPTYYADVCEKALEIKKQYNLTDVQTLLYNHICREDFYLRNGNGQMYYDLQHQGSGYFTDCNWVKRQLSKLIDNKLVKIEKRRDCRDKRCQSIYFYCPNCNIEDLINSSCFVSTHNLAMIKHYFKLPDGFSRRNSKYGDIEFLYKDRRYGFKYKGVASQFNFAWDDFSDMLHFLWETIEADGYKYIEKVPGYISTRKFII